MGDSGGVFRDYSRTKKIKVSLMKRIKEGRRNQPSSSLFLQSRHLQCEGDDNGPKASEMILKRKSTLAGVGSAGKMKLGLEDKVFVGPTQVEEKPKIEPKSALFTRLTSLSELLTKGYFYRNHDRPCSVLPISLISKQISLLTKASSFWFRILTIFYVFLFIWSSLPYADAALLSQSKCETFGWNAFPVWKYRAKPRYVTPLRMDRRMQEEFFQLFRGEVHRDKDSSEEDYSDDDVQLNIPMLQRIADMCPKDAFFYSLSPKHSEAIVAIAQMLTDVPSPPDVLRLAKALLKSPYVNPKVWYFGIIGASQERPDMTGFKLAHPVDAMPDIFIPGTLLFEVIHKYRSALENRMGRISNSTLFTSSKKPRRGKRAALTSMASSSPQYHHNQPTPRNNTIRKVIRKNVTSLTKNKKSTDTQPQSIGGQSGAAVAKGNEVRVKSELVTPTYSNYTRSDRSYKYESGSPVYSRTSRNSLKNKGWSLAGKRSKQKQKQLQKKGTNANKKPEVRKKGNNVTDEFLERSGSSWQRARTDTDAFDDCIVVDGTVGIKNGIENKLWYFREDMMVNQHHWYWHQEYPLNATKHRPRRAELFFFMHRNLIARYNAERISNGMPFVQEFDIRPGAEIQSAYNSYLADVKSGKFWTPRPHGVHLEDIIHKEDPDFERNIFIGQYNEIYGRLIRSIQVGHLLLNPIKTLKIKNTKGIEPLANTVEASQLTVNPAFYDAMGFHNLGHQLIGLATDPKWIHKVPVGVMGDTATTMRDPAFYTYHKVVDNIFDKYKRSLPPYKLRGGEYPLKWDGVEILDVEVVSKHSSSTNQLKTFWGVKKFELAPGVDHSIHKGDLDVDVCAVHMNHEPFDFKITVTLDPCAKTKSNKGTVRIFLAPRYDEHGHRLTLTAQRRHMIHMDAFPVDLRVGRNEIYRRSYDSAAVTPWSKHLSDYERAPKNPHSADFCGCGWPTHLYIPKGSPKGMPFDLFVMITNFDHDYVEDDPEDLTIPEPCNSPYLYCGVKWRQYPDAKPMGYPFDRLPFNVPLSCPEGVASIWTLVICKVAQFFWLRPVHDLEEYVSYAPNMALTVVEIKHEDHLVW